MAFVKRARLPQAEDSAPMRVSRIGSPTFPNKIKILQFQSRMQSILQLKRVQAGKTNKSPPTNSSQGAKRNLIPTKLLKTSCFIFLQRSLGLRPAGGWGYAPAMQAGERAPLGLRGLGEDFDFSP